MTECTYSEVVAVCPACGADAVHKVADAEVKRAATCGSCGEWHVVVERPRSDGGRLLRCECGVVAGTRSMAGHLADRHGFEDPDKAAAAVEVVER